MVDIINKYLVHIIDLPLGSDYKTIANQLISSAYVRKKMYLDEEQSEIELKSKFSEINVEDNILKGVAKFETVMEGTDLAGKFNILVRSHKVDFFIALTPMPHLIIISVPSLARVLSKIMSGIFFGEGTGHIRRFKLSNNQIFKFLDNNPYTLKSQINDATLDGISTIALHGSNVEKPQEFLLINKYLTEYQAIRVLLHKEDWIIWISKKTGAFSCMTPHDARDFIKFIQKKILSLPV